MVNIKERSSKQRALHDKTRKYLAIAQEEFPEHEVMVIGSITGIGVHNPKHSDSEKSLIALITPSDYEIRVYLPTFLDSAVGLAEKYEELQYGDCTVFKDY